MMHGVKTPIHRARSAKAPAEQLRELTQCLRVDYFAREFSRVGPLLRQSLERIASRAWPDAPKPGRGDEFLSGHWTTPARQGFGIVFVTFGLLGGWACFAPIDSAIVAPGSVVVESERKAVQHLEGGIVRDILIKGDTYVEEGQVLIRLDPTQARAREQIARAAVYLALAEEARLQTEAEALDEITFPTELTAGASNSTARRAIGDQIRRFQERRAARKLEVSILQERIAQSQRQIQGSMAQRKSTLSQLASVAEEYAKLKPLASKGLVPVTRVNTLERSHAELDGRVGTLEADIARFERIIDEARLQTKQVGQKMAEEASGALAETRTRLADAREQLRIAVDVLDRVDIRAPRSGRIVGLKMHTVGAVARAGETLMEIVPDDDVLVVSAKVSPLDVNHLHPGLPAEVRLPSFKSRSTPIAVGEVRSVAADALRDEGTRQSYYEIKVSVQASRFPEKIREHLRPGMPAEVIVATGERTVLAYLTQPMMDAIRRSMREE